MIRRLAQVGLAFALGALLATIAFLLLLVTDAHAACTGGSPTWTATDAAGLATCWTNAVRGDTIIVNAGTTYKGHFQFGDKGAGTNYITIQSSGLASLPAGVRVSPSDATHMAKIVAPDDGTSAIQLNVDASYIKFLGLEITTDATPGLAGQIVPQLVGIDGSGAITYNHWPNHITFDRNLLHPFETDPTPWRAARIGFGIDGSDITYTNNYVYDFCCWDPPSNTGTTVTAATAASPTEVTITSCASDPGHKFLLYLGGATGGWTPLNGVKVATYSAAGKCTLQDYDTTTFALSNVNTTGATNFGAQTVNLLTQTVDTNHAILSVAGPGPYTITNNMLEAQYSPIFTGGGGTWIDPANVVNVTAVTDLTHVTLSSLGNLQAGDLIALNGVATQTISAVASSGANCTGSGTVTCLTVTPHGFPAGTVLYTLGGLVISGFTAPWDALNTPGCTGYSCARRGTVVDSTHITVPVDSSGFGSPAGQSGTFDPLVFDHYTYQIGHVTNVNAGTKVVTYEWWGHQPENTGGTGAGFLVASGATAQFNGLVSHDYTVTRNTIAVKRYWVWLYRDLAKTSNLLYGSSPKAIWEAKMGNNVTLTGNTIQVTGGSLAPYDGFIGIAINKASQTGGEPWVGTNNWVIRSNLFKNVNYQAFQMTGEYATEVPSSGVVIDNNLFTSAATGSCFNLESSDGVTITHNTCRNAVSGSGVYYPDFIGAFSPNSSTVIRDNIGAYEVRGYNQQDSTPWTPTHDHNFLIDDNNVSCVGGSIAIAPDTCVVKGANPTASDTMLFVDYVSADAGGAWQGYCLQAGSPGHNAASDGTDAGVNCAALAAALGGLGTSLTGTATLSGHGSLHQ